MPGRAFRSWWPGWWRTRRADGERSEAWRRRRSSPRSTVRSAASCARSPTSCRAGCAARRRRSSGSARGRSARSPRVGFLARHHPLRRSSSAARSAALGDWLLVFVGFGIEDVRDRRRQGDVGDRRSWNSSSSAARWSPSTSRRRRSASRELPWVERATVRKFYPGTLAVEIDGAQALRALAARRRGLRHRPRPAPRSCRSRNRASPSCRFMVGGGANADGGGLPRRRC